MTWTWHFPDNGMENHTKDQTHRFKINHYKMMALLSYATCNKESKNIAKIDPGLSSVYFTQFSKLL
jgi:hypothetical protein